MKMLALDFSAPQRSAAVVIDGASHGTVAQGGERVTNTASMIARALSLAGLEREAIEAIAIGLGPGSYTGIRAAIAFAEGWQLGRRVLLRGVRTADCLAAQARDLGWSGTVHVVIDAQRQELYLATFAISTNGVTTLEPLRIVTLAEARARVAGGGLVCGPEAPRWFEGGVVLSPDAAVLGRIASAGNPGLASEQLEPVYLRETNFVKAPPPRVLPAL